MSKVKREGETRSTAWLLIFVTVSVFCVVFFASRGRFETTFSSPAVITLVAPFQRAASWAGSQIGALTANVRDILAVHKQNRMLRSEVEELRVQNVAASEYSAENIRLRELLDYKNSANQFDLVMARIIGRETSTWTRMVVIDRGTHHGVNSNMAVVTSRGLVGRVTEAGPISATVQLILDPRASAGALVQRSRVAGVVKGSPDDAMHPRMVNVPKGSDLAEGDVVVTSGFGGIYPKGLVIGAVTAVKNDSGGLLNYAVIEPAVDFQRLEDVAVIVASREAPPEPLLPPLQTPGTETDAKAAAAKKKDEERLREILVKEQKIRELQQEIQSLWQEMPKEKRPQAQPDKAAQNGAGQKRAEESRTNDDDSAQKAPIDATGDGENQDSAPSEEPPAANPPAKPAANPPSPPGKAPGPKAPPKGKAAETKR